MGEIARQPLPFGGVPAEVHKAEGCRHGYHRGNQGTRNGGGQGISSYLQYTSMAKPPKTKEDEPSLGHLNIIPTRLSSFEPC